MNDAETSRAVVRRFFELANAGEMDACFALFSEDLVWHNLGTHRFAGTFRGLPTVSEQLIGPLFGSLKAGIRSEIDALIAEGDTVVALTRGHAETTDGVPYDNRYCQVMRVQDGRIVEVTEYADTALIDRVFGPA